MILVLSGTEEGKEIVRKLHDAGLRLLTTVATDYGKKIFEQMGLESLCLQGRLDANGFLQLIRERKINTVVDATHPYAVEVSRNAMEACSKENVRYLRYERQETEIPNHPLIHNVKTMEEAVVKAGSLGEKNIADNGYNKCRQIHRPEGRKGIVRAYIARTRPHRLMPEHGHSSHPYHCHARPVFRGFKPRHVQTISNQYDSYEGQWRRGGVLEKIRPALAEHINTIVIERPKIHFKRSTRPLTTW